MGNMVETARNKSAIFLAALLLASASGPAISSAQAASLKSLLANRTIICAGGSENRGRDYKFVTKPTQVARLDHRFPESRLDFQIGQGVKENLGNGWSYETLSTKEQNHLMLYERLSLRSPSQTRHIYRTYDLYSYGGKIYMTIYDGVNGAREWKMKVTRDCHLPDGSIFASSGNRFWSPSSSLTR